MFQPCKGSAIQVISLSYTLSSPNYRYGVSTLKHYSVIHKRVSWRLKTATYYVCYISLSDVIYIQMLKSHYWAKIVALDPLKWAELVSDDLLFYIILLFTFSYENILQVILFGRLPNIITLVWVLNHLIFA